VDRDDEFEQFFRDAEPRLRRAFVGSHGTDGAGDAVAEALSWAWEHWEQVVVMSNPMGYLYRVGQSHTRVRRPPVLPPPDAIGVPEVEPQLIPALLALTASQRSAVWLVHGCGWHYAEVAEALNISVSAVGTHVHRGLDHLRAAIGGLERA
jgi:DNA-directed RNA polymerase specialized sigma24 family protein